MNEDKDEKEDKIRDKKREKSLLYICEKKIK